MRGSLLGNDSHTHMEHLSIKSLICFDTPGHQTDILWINGTIGHFDGLHGKFLAALKEK